MERLLSGTNMTTGLLLVNTTYVLTSVTDNFGCPAQGLVHQYYNSWFCTNSCHINRQRGCMSGATSTIKSVITGGASYIYNQLHKKRSCSGTDTTIYRGTDFSLGVLPVGTYNYQITSVTDFCGNLFLPSGYPRFIQ